MALEVNLVAAARMILAAPEMLQTNFVEGGLRRIAGDVAADANARALLAVNQNCSVPAQPVADVAFILHIAGIRHLVLNRDGVHEVR